jgi:hypothetical protein
LIQPDEILRNAGLEKRVTSGPLCGQASFTAWQSTLSACCALIFKYLSPEGWLVAKPNYSFEKRQRELAKKKKKEEKLKEKAERKPGDPEVLDDAPDTEAPAQLAPPVNTN